MNRLAFLLCILLVFPVATLQAACTNPAETAGVQFYNTTYNVMQYCNGTDWINMGGLSSGVTAAGSTGYVQYNDSNVLAGSSSLFWDSTNSRLGIGVSSPTTQLTIGTSGTITVQNGGSTSAPAFAVTTGALGVNGLYVPAANSVALVTAATERLRINSAGNVGIGTTSPAAKLHLSGGTSGSTAGFLRLEDSAGNYRSLYMTANNNTLGFYHTSNVATLSNAGVWTNASDRRIKKNIHPTRYGLDAVMELQPVDYEMKSDGTSQVGLIAQDVEKIIPVVVSPPISSEANYTLSYGNLVAVALRSIQELKAENDNFAAKVDAQEKRIQQLEAASK